MEDEENDYRQGCSARWRAAGTHSFLGFSPGNSENGASAPVLAKFRRAVAQRLKARHPKLNFLNK